MKNSKVVPIDNMFGIQYDRWIHYSDTYERTIFKDINGDRLLFPTYKLAQEWLDARIDIEKIF